jgi:DNA-binding MurR/RpiR family transcriptional regulator
MIQMNHALSSARLGGVPAAADMAKGLPLAQVLELRLAEVRGNLSANDERIADFLRGHLDGLAFHTAGSLAQGAGVSAAAVVRFSRRLGLESFRELRDVAREELRSERSPTSIGTVGESALARKAQADIAKLELLPHLLGDKVAEAAALIAGANSTSLLAGRETYGLAVYAYRLLHHVHRAVHLVDPSFPDDLRDVGAGDVVLAISFRPYSRQTIDLLGHARSMGARVVLITDGLAHDFIDPDDLALAVPVESPTLFLSFVPALSVLESLAATVAELDAERTTETLEATAGFIEDLGLVSERDPGGVDPGA